MQWQWNIKKLQRKKTPEMLGQPDPVGGKIADTEPIIARSASAVRPREKKFN